MKVKKMNIREACRQRKPLDGTDAQALEHGLTQLEEENAKLSAEVAGLTQKLEKALADLELAKKFHGDEYTNRVNLTAEIERLKARNLDCENKAFVAGGDLAGALLQVEELRVELKKAHDGHGYRNGLGPCVCKWCAEKPKSAPWTQEQKEALAKVCDTFTGTLKQKCEHKWFHVEDGHCICEKCKAIEDFPLV